MATDPPEADNEMVSALHSRRVIRYYPTQHPHHLSTIALTWLLVSGWESDMKSNIQNSQSAVGN
ncbi:unnamed protein product [Penicillium camemberti]|uniref:Str. FM013 n=1 Tax=Penicillium camemberti (strain FM 013) TaxID=1429867 RepID=A0A0G4P677_PENC3|nr:unnamed protein product [Penicillium camemberti]